MTDVLNSVGITSQTIQTLYNGILQIFNLVVAIIAAMLCERLGRRLLFITSTAGMLVSFVAWTICASLIAQNPDNLAAGRAVLALIFFFYGFYDIACAFDPSRQVSSHSARVRPAF